MNRSTPGKGVKERGRKGSNLLLTHGKACVKSRLDPFSGDLEPQIRRIWEDEELYVTLAKSSQCRRRPDFDHRADLSLHPKRAAPKRLTRLYDENVDIRKR